MVRSGSLPPLADVMSILSGIGSASRYGQRVAVAEEAAFLGANRRPHVRLPFAMPCRALLVLVDVLARVTAEAAAEACTMLPA